MSFIHSNLDLIRLIDRMGFTNSYVFDSLRRKVAETNAVGAVTLYSYCTCGALDAILNAAGNLTSFHYDNLGRMTNAAYPDGFGVTNNYNLLGQPANVTDSAGTSTTNWFDNQGLQVAVTVLRQFNSADKNLAAKALCFLQKILGSQIYYPYYPDAYLANLQGGLQGLTAPVPTSQGSGKWVFIDKQLLPNDESKLLAMLHFGATLAHEFDHFFSNSTDKPGGPSDRINKPADNNYEKALNTKTVCECADGQTAYNLVQKAACECGINFAKRSTSEK